MTVTPLLSMDYNYGIMKKAKEENCICHFHNYFPQVPMITQVAEQMPCDRAVGFQVLLHSQSIFLDNKTTPPLPPFAPNTLLFFISVM